MTKAAALRPRTAPVARLLVTGAGGFIGQALCARLAGVLPVRATVRARQAATEPAADEVLEIADLVTSDALPAALRDVSHVVHLAGLRSNDRGGQTPAELERVNVQGAVRIANEARAAGVQRLVFVSSIAAVRSLSDEPVDDRTEPAPANPYGASKLRAEQALIAALEGSGVELVILRPPLVYGRGHPPHLRKLWNCVRLGIPLPFEGVENRRSFLAIENLVSAIEAVLTHPGVDGRAFALADPDVLSTPELIALMARTAGRPPRLFHAPAALLRLGARGVDRLNDLGLDLPFTSEALAQCIGSLAIDDTEFRRVTGWRPAVRTHDAIASAFNLDANGKGK